MISEERLVALLTEALERRGSIYPPEHAAFVDTLILREKRRQELWSAIQKQVLGVAAVAFIGWLGNAVLEGVRAYFAGVMPR